MVEKNLIATLRKIDFFAGFDEKYLEKISDIADEVDFESGKVIFREGDAAENVYLIVTGSVSLEVCAPAVGCRRILTIDAGDLLGWSPLFSYARLTSTARALAPTCAIRITSTQVLTLCEHDARFGYEFMRRVAEGLAKRLRAARLQLLDVFGSETPTIAQAGPSQSSNESA